MYILSLKTATDFMFVLVVRRISGNWDWHTANAVFWKTGSYRIPAESIHLPLKQKHVQGLWKFSNRFLLSSRHDNELENS